MSGTNCLSIAKVANDFDLEKVRAFKERFFDDLDGKSAERIVKELIK
ncbi:hypothetical protein [Listeria ivanovii]|nr:hypothetical protein [Listeria ivanovii]MBK1965281.1 hypothetical protein [Listeria ivanovii subsp. londoniensis]MBK1984735.1 hypothetical protein [Listeria ivanovii subsp. londoniensis]MBK1994448.1 hypothetical protein [Listeria ivanovii subsp. londoniensis]